MLIALRAGAGAGVGVARRTSNSLLQPRLEKSLARALASRPAPTAVVVGGSGELGRAVVSALAPTWHVVAVDVAAPAPASGAPARAADAAPHASVVLSAAEARDPAAVVAAVLRALPAGGSAGGGAAGGARAAAVGAVVCTAGGWAGGGAADAASLGPALDRLTDVCLRPALASAALASAALAPAGALVLTGAAAAAARGGTPGMLVYGALKAATHHVARSMMAARGAGGLPAGARVLCVAPGTLDTPANRAHAAPGAEADWTPPAELARAIAGWLDGDAGAGIALEGGVVAVETRGGRTTFQVVPERES